MCFFRKNRCETPNIPTKFHVGDFVDFWHRDDVYFGTVSNITFNEQNEIFYDVDIAGQCPTTYCKIPEAKVIRKREQ